MEVHLSLAEPVECEDLGEIAEGIVEIGDQVSDERECEAGPVEPLQRLFERVCLPGARPCNNELLHRVRAHDRVRRGRSPLCQLGPDLVAAHFRRL